MDCITIIDGVGFHRNHVAVFKNDERIILDKVDPLNMKNVIKNIRDQFNGLSCSELNCSGSYREFVAVSDFPTSLKQYFK